MALSDRDQRTEWELKVEQMAINIEQMRADLALKRADMDLKRKQSFWETPKGVAAVIATTAVAVGTAAGLAGYKYGSTPAAPTQIVFQPGSIVLQVPAPPAKP